MSGMSNPPAPSSAPPSLGRADDLFALAKFVMSEESQVYLKHLHDVEARSKSLLEEATVSKSNLDQAWSDYHDRAEKLDKDRAAFEESSALRTDMHSTRQSALQARENEVSKREEKCAARERELNAADVSWLTKVNAREAELSLREKDISRRAMELENREAVFERKQQAIMQAMRS